MKLNILKKVDEHEFKPLLVEIEEEPTSPLGRIILWLILGAILTGLLILFIAKIDVVVSGTGLIIPEGEVKIIQPLEGGIINKINVKVGDFVNKGDILMEIDPSAVAPDFQSKKENLAVIIEEKECLEALLEGITTKCSGKKLAKYLQSITNMEDQFAVKNVQTMQINEEIDSAALQIKAYKDILESEQERYQKLETVKDIIGLDEIKKSRETILNLNKEIGSLEYGILAKQHQKKQIEKEIDLVKGTVNQEWQKELSELNKTYSSLKGEVDQTAFRHEKQQIFSPVDGYINTLLINTVGGVVTSAQQLLSIVPINTNLLAKALVLNKDIGFIAVGQDCVIKIDTFDFQKYGKISGKIMHISADSIENEQLGRVYEIYVQPEKTLMVVDGKEMQITSGMSLVAEIKVGKRRIIEFFIYPAIRYLDEGLSVR